jgi:hypothetical protein
MKAQIAALLAVAALAGGCASGGGGGGSSSGMSEEDEFMCALIPVACIFAAPATPPPDCCTPRPNETFTRWEDHVWDRVDVQGVQVTAPYSGPSSDKVVAVLEGTIAGTNVTAYYDPQRRLGTLNLPNEQLDPPYSSNPTFSGHESIDVLPSYGSSTGSNGLAANPYRLGWSYQSFGAWDSVQNMQFGGASFGAATPGYAVPGSGTGVFTGKLAGFYVSPAGEVAATAADLTVNVDFSARTVGLQSTNSRFNNSVSPEAPHLNVGGTLRYSPGSNAFSGTLSNAGGTMSGPSQGAFYGPSAQELGGVFALKAPGTVEAFTGAYGAKR